MKYRFCLVLLPFFVVMLLGGCQKGLKVQYVEGTVKHDGTPLAGAMVSFSPKSEGSVALLASGVTNDQGVYKLTVIQGGKVDGGTTVGDYAVSIMKKTTGPIRMDPPPPAYPNSAKVPIYGNVIPKKYTNPNTSGLTASVKSGKNLGIDFELTGPGDKTISP